LNVTKFAIKHRKKKESEDYHEVYHESEKNEIAMLREKGDCLSVTVNHQTPSL
jgi:hypothetical protein